MKRVGGLFDRAACFETLVAAARRAARGKHHKPEVASFLFHLETEALRLERELLQGSYRPGPYRSFRIRDPKPRLISAAPFRDRVVHHAVMAVLEPVLEARADAHSYACRKGKGTLAALRRTRRCAKSWPWFLKLDVAAFFASVDHGVLEALLRRILKDVRLLDLLVRIVETPVVAAASCRWSVPESKPGRGLAIGSLCSQHLANHYLAPLDRFVRQEVKPKAYIRYMDDMLLFEAGKGALREAAGRVAEYMTSALRLELNPRATLLAPVRQGIPFLGFQVFPGVVRLRPATLRRFVHKIRARIADLEAGDLEEDEAIRSLCSLVGHTMHADTLLLRRRIFARMSAGRGANRAPTG